MKQVHGVQFIILSTPDRLIVRNWFDFGPPRNWTHMREWSGKEFARYISEHFNVISHQISRYDQGTQVIVCRPMSK